MSENLSWAALKRFVYERAKGLCEYCQTAEANTAQPMHTEHINPAGGDIAENLCLACTNCNLSKARAISAEDPESKTLVPLFNPRKDSWQEHFKWRDNGLILEGLTPVGRATIQRLKINQDRVLIARRRWIMGGFHPPK